MPDQEQPQPRKFSESLFLIPFGRYRPDRMRSDPAAANYVGREGQRAFLIEALTGGGKRGAYLVTGRRGVGKTTFVESCINEYQEATFRRFLRSNYGRSPFDLIMMAFLAISVIFIFMAASNFVGILAVDSHENKSLLLPLIVVSFFILIPFFYGWLIITKIIKSYGTTHGSIVGFISTSIIAYILWTSESMNGSAPVLSMSITLLIICFTYTLSSFLYATENDQFHILKLTQKIYNRDNFKSIIAFLIILVEIAFLFTPAFLPSSIEAAKGMPTSPVLVMSFSILLFSIGLLTHYIRKESLHNRELLAHLEIRKDIKNDKTRYLLILLLFTVSSLYFCFILLNEKKTIALWVFLIAILIMMLHKICFHANHIKTRDVKFIPPIKILLLFKAIFLIFFSMQLIYPVFSAFPLIYEKILPEESHKSLSSCEFQFKNKGKSCNIEDGRIKYKGNYENRINASLNKGEVYLTHFISSANDEEYWLIITLLIIIFIYYLEYEWINKPFIAQRQSNVLDRGHRLPLLPNHPADFSWNRKSLEDDDKEKRKEYTELLEARSIYLFRSFEKLTFSYILCQLWMPAIVARVNLGFDALDHKGVTHSMLHALKNEYRKNLISWKSIYGQVSIFITAILCLSLVTLLSSKYIDFPKLTDGKKVESIMNDGALTHEDIKNLYEEDKSIKKTNYCELLEIYGDHLLKKKERDFDIGFIGSLCGISQSFTNSILPYLFSTIIKIPANNTAFTETEEEDGGKTLKSFIDEHFIYLLFHYNNGLPHIDSEGKFHQEPSLSLRVYHAMVFLILIVILTKISRVISIFPYKRTERKIRLLIDALNKSRTDRNSETASLSHKFAIFSKTQGYETSREAMDPRTIELEFLNLLEQMQDASLRLPAFPYIKISIPTPEIHFIFDELDKITGSISTDKDAWVNTENPNDIIAGERKRAIGLHSLMSDMKRIISSAPARFIFVGGRILHDEWMADQGRRQPLLTSIFDAEIYLPSLMLDIPDYQIIKAKPENSESAVTANRYDLSYRIREYFLRTHNETQSLFKQVMLSRFQPFFLLDKIEYSAAKFFELRFTPEYERDLGKAIKVVNWRWRWDYSDKKLFKEHSKTLAKRDEIRKAFIDDLIYFLTYRSAGAPKKLQEILSSFIRPAARFTDEQDTERYELLPCRDVLAFPNKDIYRVQFISSLFQHINDLFKHSLLGRDDKVSVNIIYLFDFLLKFHGRAFSWLSLNHIDELAHIHRAPDIKKVFADVVEASGETHLHSLLNGLYTFRFRSEFAVEIRYLSRLSQPEMAAMNFTLDESQELKAIYTTLLESGGEQNEELYSSLGELYELDQAYEIARNHYRKSIRIIDDNFAKYVGEEVDVHDPIQDNLEQVIADIQAKGHNKLVTSHNQYSTQTTVDLRHLATLMTNISGNERVPYLKAILMHDADGQKNALHFIPWVIRRVRLMLQIGLTFELDRDFERSQVHYHATRRLATSVINSAFRENSIEEQIAPGAEHLLKHMNVLFQPVFAEAWVGEKLESAIDTSSSIIEIYLSELRSSIPFISERGITRNEDTVTEYLSDKKSRVGNSNLALISAELHDKAGDLYFFKGRLPLKKEYLDNHQIFGDESFRENTDYSHIGYLFKAHFHYAVSLHERVQPVSRSFP